jgi:hypothetical protein
MEKTTFSSIITFLGTSASHLGKKRPAGGGNLPARGGESKGKILLPLSDAAQTE